MAVSDRRPARPQRAGDRGPHVVIVGGGLAGLAAAAALVDSGLTVTVLEARRRAGGRAASFEDPLGGGLVDACQHVAMGCCTNVVDLCRRAGLDGFLRRDRRLWFISPDGTRAACTPSRLLPAPLHLVPLLSALGHFSLRDKWALATGMLRLARLRPGGSGGNRTAADRPGLTAATWLAAIGQPETVVRLFWQPVLESALGESLDLVDVAAARKVVVDGFLAHRDAADLLVPTEPLGTLFGERLVGWLAGRGVEVRTAATVTAIERDDTGAHRVETSTGGIACDAAIVAVPWRQAARLLGDLLPVADDRLAGSPITAVHLWFDREVVDLPHAVLVGRTSQWVFRGEDGGGAAPEAGRGYCQVVISASRGLCDGDRQRLLAAVVQDVRDTFPAARDATLVNARIVTDPTAVLSVRPGVDAARPAAGTRVPGLFLAGDWTATGWPSTMEGAVRSGRLAAEAVAAHFGLPLTALVADLPRGPLVRLLLGG